MAYKKGDRVRIRLTGLIMNEGSRFGTVAVEETEGKGSGYAHYLFLGSEDSRKSVLGPGPQADRAPEAGDTITADFEAIVAEIEDGASRTSWVTSAEGYNHSVFLGSPSVTLVTEEAPPSPYVPGDVLSVELTGTVLDRSANINATSRVRENGTELVHYLYLSTLSREAILGSTADVAAGDTIRAAFTCTVLEKDANPAGTVRVRGPRGLTSYVCAASPSVRLAEPGLPGGVTRITSDQALARITALEKTAGCQVIRNRNDEVVFLASTEEACRAYLEDEDLLPERFTLRKGELGGPGAQEIARLRRLAAIMELTMSGSPWTLCSAGYFTRAWVLNELTGAGMTPDFSSWPLNLATPEAITAARRDSLYQPVEIDGTTYYASL